MTTAQIKRWKDVSGHDLANAIYKTVNGNCPLLEEGHGLETSVWATVVLHLGSNFNEYLDRFWARTAFLENRSSCRDLHRSMCSSQNIQYLEPLNLRSVSISLPKLNPSVFCICRKQFNQSTEENMIECDECKDWFHAICMDEPFEKYRNKNVKYVCKKCKNFNPKKYLPRLFRTEYLNTSICQEETFSAGPIHASTPINPPHFKSIINKGGVSTASEEPHLGSTSTPKCKEPCAVSELQGHDSDLEDDMDKSEVEDGKSTSSVCSSLNNSDLEDEVKYRTDVIQDDDSEENCDVDDGLELESILSVQNSKAETGRASKQEKVDTLPLEKSESEVPEITKLGIGQPIGDEDDGNEGPIQTHTSFCTSITWCDWKEICPEIKKTNSSKGHTYRMKFNAWTMVFYDAFLRKCTPAMAGCRLSFQYHKIRKSHSTGNYLTAFATCTREKNKCTMEYTFTIPNKPKSGDITVLVHPNGLLLHDLTKDCKRFLAGPKKKDIIEKLKTCTPSRLRTQLYADTETNEVALKKNNLTQVSTLNVLKRNRAEALAENDLDKDVFLDLIAIKKKLNSEDHLKGLKFNGYIQMLNLFPFMVSMYTNKQFEILKRLLDWNPDCVLHLDATGKVVRKLPMAYSGKRIFYYAVVVHIPGSDIATVVPILEFFSNQHDTVQIAHALHEFLHRYRDFAGASARQPFFGIKRIETDNSMALISATMQAMEAGTVHMFLRNAWTGLIDRTKTVYSHHICRRHSSKFITTMFQKIYKDRPETFAVWTSWMHGFLRGKSLWSFCRRVRDAILLSGIETMTGKVKYSIRHIGDATPQVGTQPWTLIRVSDVPIFPPLYAQSPFGYYSLALCKHLGVDLPKSLDNHVTSNIQREDSSDDESDETMESQKIPNPYYSPEFLEYLCLHIFPMACLFDHSLMYLNEALVKPDTNNPVESWNNIFKNVEATEKLPVRVGRLVQRNEIILKGRIRIFDNELKKREQGKVRLNNMNLNTNKNLIHEELPLDKPPLGFLNTKLRNDNAETTPGKKSSNKRSQYPSTAVDKSYNEDAEFSEISSQSGSDAEIPVSASSLDYKTKPQSRETPKKGDPSKIPETASEQWNRNTGKRPNTGESYSHLHTLNLIPWGGTVRHEGREVKVWDTCSIDNILQILYVMYKAEKSFRDYIDAFRTIGCVTSKTLIRIFQSLDNREFDKARTYTTLDLMKLGDKLTISGNLEGSEEDFLSTIASFVKLQQHRTCSNSNCKLSKLEDVYPMRDFDISSSRMLLLKCNSRIKQVCSCPGKHECEIWYEFATEGAPPFFAFAIAHGGSELVTESTIAQIYTICRQKYELFAYTVNYNHHFTTVFSLQSGRRKVMYNGLSPSSLQKHVPYADGHQVSTVWLKKL